MSRIESFPIDLGDSYEKVLNSCGLDEYDQNSVIITRNRVLEEIRSSIHQRRGNSLKSTMLDLKAYTTDYAKQQCDDLQEQLKELSDEKDVLKKDNDKKDKRVSECNAKITELESYYYKYITLCDYIVRINANPVREVITETIMRYSKKGKIKDSDHTFTGEVREILIALIRDEFRDYSLSNDNVSHEALYEKINMNIDFEATIGDRLYKGGLFSRSAKQSDFVDLMYDLIDAFIVQLKSEVIEQINLQKRAVKEISEDYLRYKQWKTESERNIANNSSMNSCIGNEEDNSESDWSIKKNFCDINKKIEELLRKIELQDEMIRTFGEKYKYLEKSQNNMLKMIVVGELISVISVITLIMMQIF